MSAAVGAENTRIVSDSNEAFLVLEPAMWGLARPLRSEDGMNIYRTDVKPLSARVWAILGKLYRFKADRDGCGDAARLSTTGRGS